MNWARRSDCNMCGHPKFSKVEQRTGEKITFLCCHDNVLDLTVK